MATERNRARTLGEVIAVEKAARQAANKTVAVVYQDIQKPALVAGFTQVLKPDVQPEDGRKILPDEGNRLRLRTEQAIREMVRLLTPSVDLTAAKDWANCAAREDVITPDGTVLLEQVPVTHLLWLEHQFTEVLAFMKATQEVDPKDEWEWDASNDFYRSDPEYRVCTQKKTVPIILLQPTQWQQGKAELISEETRLGLWEITRFSGALAPQRKRQLAERAEALVVALKQARERANRAPAPVRDVAGPLFGYLLAQ